MGMRSRPPSKVYPRVGGETGASIAWPTTSNGLSPRGRGNHALRVGLVRPPRSIPAWAGKPRPGRWSTITWRVYPRVGGETTYHSVCAVTAGGLSPRGRGNPVRPQDVVAHLGSIPAWAGKPRCRRRFHRQREVYPRVGGETYDPGEWQPPVAGLSPRGRGNRRAWPRNRTEFGSIPAWAGKPVGRDGPAAFTEVYPRVGGETRWRRSSAVIGLGLSPRGRGNRPDELRELPADGSIPAWAGKPQSTATPLGIAKVYPRVGGETAAAMAHIDEGVGLSPRGRGNPRRRLPSAAVPRSIPAWAGKPHDFSDSITSRQVYPRVGGETARRSGIRPNKVGLSPRGRGNRRGHHLRGRGRGLSPRGRGNLVTSAMMMSWTRSIPAWAGKPPTRYRRKTHDRVYPRVGGETDDALFVLFLALGLSPRGRGNPAADH